MCLSPTLNPSLLRPLPLPSFPGLLQVSFKLFGLLPGAVALRGKVLPVPAGQPHGLTTAGERDTVRVLFEPPVLSLGDALHFRIGEHGVVADTHMHTR